MQVEFRGNVRAFFLWGQKQTVRNRELRIKRGSVKRGLSVLRLFIGGILQSIGEITIQLISNGESILCHLVDSGAVDSIIQQLKN